MHINKPIFDENYKLTEQNIEIDKKKTEANEIDIKSKTINQIKNISQEKDIKPKAISEKIKKIEINSFEKLIEICSLKKEVRLKYELENNVNLVSFESKRIEISFNENLDKNFLKDLSNKLYEWTNERWIITLTRSKGQLSISEQKISKKKSKD